MGPKGILKEGASHVSSKGGRDRPVMNGRRRGDDRSCPAWPSLPCHTSHFGSFDCFQPIVNLNPGVADGALEPGVAGERANGQRGLGAARECMPRRQRVRPLSVIGIALCANSLNSKLAEPNSTVNAATYASVHIEDN